MALQLSNGPVQPDWIWFDGAAEPLQLVRKVLVTNHALQEANSFFMVFVSDNPRGCNSRAQSSMMIRIHQQRSRPLFGDIAKRLNRLATHVVAGVFEYFLQKVNCVWRPTFNGAMNDTVHDHPIRSVKVLR